MGCFCTRLAFFCCRNWSVQTVTVVFNRMLMEIIKYCQWLEKKPTLVQHRPHGPTVCFNHCLGRCYKDWWKQRYSRLCTNARLTGLSFNSGSFKNSTCQKTWCSTDKSISYFYHYIAFFLHCLITKCCHRYPHTVPLFPSDDSTFQPNRI